jgi:predicted nucleic acid-binding protein
MIVADANLLTALLLGPDAGVAERVFERDPAWAAPTLWRSEFRSVLFGYIRRRGLTPANAMLLHERAEQLLASREFTIAADAVLRLAGECPCSAYDCEYVVLARTLRVPLVTWDRQLLRAFPALARTPEAFAE